ncbi:hypothetical protein ACIF9R_26830 [Streptomyces sp. NPDC086080]|uniref:hypothetical protein n=1 Tax=Streptomyces sp. NPDC086080 TaxID=3365748 RepID=UPI0037CF69F4
MRRFVKPAAGLPAPRLVRPLLRLAPNEPDEPEEPGPSRSPRERGADRDSAPAARRTVDGIRPCRSQNRAAA